MKYSYLLMMVYNENINSIINEYQLDYQICSFNLFDIYKLCVELFKYKKYKLCMIKEKNE